MIFALLLFLQSLFAPPEKIVVIGAGLAGLTAAHRLYSQGHDVTVYEARSRPGGRVFTYINGDSYEELGGKYLNDAENSTDIRALAQEFRLEIETESFAQSTLQPAFALLKDIQPAGDDLRIALSEKAKEVSHLGELLDAFIEPSSELRRLIEIRMRNYEGLASSELSTYYFDSFFKFYKLCCQLFQESQTPFRLDKIKEGNSRLIEALCQTLQGRVIYNTPLVSISKGHQKAVALHFRDGTSTEADRLILALPCSTLREVNIERDLIPPDQMEAIATLSYGTTAKILIPIRLASPNKTTFPFTNEGIMWLNGDHSILTCYCGGPAGVFDSSSPTELSYILQRNLPFLQQFFPDASFSLDVQPVPPSSQPFVQGSGPVGISWAHEAFSRGGYSAMGPGQEKIFLPTQEVLGETVKTAFRPVDNIIFFAGEHTAIYDPATMGGAVESGERAARMLKRRLTRAVNRW